MSKISFTIALPHDGPDGNRTPQFFISTSNMTFLSFKGTDFKGARIGNNNASSGWKNRFEYSVVAAKGITKFSIQMNTSVILPPLSWGLPGPPAKGKDKEKEKVKEKESKRSKSERPSGGSSRSESSKSSSSRSSRSSRPSRGSYDSKENSKRSERQHENPQLRSSDQPRRLRDLEDQTYGRHAQRRRGGSRREMDPGIVDVDGQ